VIFSFSSIVLFAAGSYAIWHLAAAFVLGEAFKNSLVYVFLTICSSAFRGFFTIASLFIYYTTKTWILSLLTLLATGLNVFFTWMFITRFGLIGVAYAPIIAWSVTAIVSVLVAVKLISMIHDTHRT
jgi:O-antigen/teichoic acid export membrane protein